VAAVGRGEFLSEQDPPPGMEPAIEAAVRARFRGAPSPRAAHGAEAEVVGDVVGEDAAGDQPSWPIAEIRPVPLQGSGGGGVVAVGTGKSVDGAAPPPDFILGLGFFSSEFILGRWKGATSYWASAVCVALE
jgi:hypothetical protein